MANQIYLRNAPIVEAIIDLRVKLPANFNQKLIGVAAAEMKNAYPFLEEQASFGAKMEVNPRGTSFSADPPAFLGLMLKNPEKRQIAQFRLDGFSFSRLKPYTSWNQVSEEARRLWEVYVAICSPDSVSRIAVRYINRMEIPGGEIELCDYLAYPPLIPQNLSFTPVTLGYFHKSTIADRHRAINVTLIQTSEPNPDPEKSTLIIDIDVYKTGEYQLTDDLFGFLDILRQIKNELFFKSVTEKTVELFK